MAQVLPSACCHHPQNIYHTPYIEEHFDEIVKESIAVSEKVCKLYDGIVADDRKGVYKFTGDINSTWLYPVYNVFAASSPSKHFYEIYRFISESVKHYITEIVGYYPTCQVWIQAWINVHTHENLLKRHTHKFPFHGYLSIDPKDSTTFFYYNSTGTPSPGKDFRIQNAPGKLYIGPGHQFHEVLCDKVDDYRITLAFNLITSDDADFNYNKIDGSSFIPLL